MDLLVLATDHGVVMCTGTDGRYHPSWSELGGHHVTALAVREKVILAGTRDGIHRSEDGGQSWWASDEGLTIRHVRSLAVNQAGAFLIGTEPADVFLSRDEGEAWSSEGEVPRLRDKGGWFLPYSPEAGCVRGFAFHASRAYGAVEVGGLLRSDDGGLTWRLARGSTGDGTLDPPPSGHVHSDVHSVSTHPSSPDLVFAATSGGLYISIDGGDSWRVSHEGSYCRAVWVDPTNSNHVILGPADGVSRNGRIEESFDGGATWEDASTGLDLPWPHRMVERFREMDGFLYAVTNDGRLYRSSVQTPEWVRLLEEVEGLNDVAAAPA